MLKVFNACALCGGSVVQRCLCQCLSGHCKYLSQLSCRPVFFVHLYVELITFRFPLALLSQRHKFQVAIPGRFRQFWRFSVSLYIEAMTSLSHRQTKVPLRRADSL